MSCNAISNLLHDEQICKSCPLVRNFIEIFMVEWLFVVSLACCQHQCISIRAKVQCLKKKSLLPIEVDVIQLSNLLGSFNLSNSIGPFSNALAGNKTPSPIIITEMNPLINTNRCRWQERNTFLPFVFHWREPSKSKGGFRHYKNQCLFGLVHCVFFFFCFFLAAFLQRNLTINLKWREEHKHNRNNWCF